MAKLGELVEFNPPAEGWNLPDSTPVSFVPMRAVAEETGKIDASEVRTLGEVRKGYTSFREGDLLFAKITPCMENGKIAIAPPLENGLGFGSTEFMVLRPYARFEIRYLWHFLLQQGFRSQAEREMKGAVGQKRVPKSFMENYTLPLPPLKEQKRIVARIEKLLSELDVGIAEAKATLSKVREIRQATLRDAFSGKLTRIWREERVDVGETAHQLLGRILQARRSHWTQHRLANLGRRRRAEGLSPSEVRKAIEKERPKVEAQYVDPDQPNTNDLPSIPDGWIWTTLETYADIAGGITVNKGRKISKPRAVPYLRVANVQRGYIDLSDVKRIEVEADELSSLLLRKGDILLNEGGDRDKLGRGWVWNGELPRCIHQNHVFRARPFISDFDARFVSHYINEFGQRYFFEKATQTTNLASISKSKVNRLPIPLPYFEEHKLILAEISRQMKAADAIEVQATSSIAGAKAVRETILRDAFRGKLVYQDAHDEPASMLLEEARSERLRVETDRKSARRRRRTPKSSEHFRGPCMKADPAQQYNLQDAFGRINGEPNAERLFRAAGFEQPFEFYDALTRAPDVLSAFMKPSTTAQRSDLSLEAPNRSSRKARPGRFRLHELWIERFRNLENYTIRFDHHHALDVLLGWNGTGKSNLFEAIIVIFRDLYRWKEKKKWDPDGSMQGYRIRYEIENRLVEVAWDLGLRRPEVRISPEADVLDEKRELEPSSRDHLLLPHFVFGYYSGPSSRFLDLFAELKQEHYRRLLSRQSDDPETMARLLEDRRFFCAETLHANYALLAFFYHEDPKIRCFLKQHLRVDDFESVLFVLKRPRWAHNNDPEDFWGAFGVLRPFLERLRCLAVAPMVRAQKVDDGYQESVRDLYFLFLPNKERLQLLAAQYPDASSFFVALESTDFSSIIQEVRIRVRIDAGPGKQISITFKEMSEGEQQLLMVLGLLRFTKTNQSLILLDEPDTHLNPHWQLGYLRLLFEALVGQSGTNDSETLSAPIETLETQLSSQLLLATHDPIAIASLLKENIHLLKRDPKTQTCVCLPARENPRGMGFTGILTSEMFGLRSDLDPETLELLDRHIDLAGKKELDSAEKKQLEQLTAEIEALGFKSANSDPYYRAFVQALVRRHDVRQKLLKPTLDSADWEVLARETDEILAQIEKEEASRKE